MIRPSLLHPRAERRSAPRHRGAPLEHPPAPAAAAVAPFVQSCDPAVQRVREAGGPVDHAAYACACGYLFDAAVSTTVTCPQCGTGQAW